MKPKSTILIIAGSDSSGGAGIQADLKTVTSLGSYGMTAITAVTVQNTTGVKSVVSINPKKIYEQIVFTSKDIKPDAIKIGMLHSTEVIKKVLKALKKIKVKKIILDPVMIAKGGARLIDEKAIKILKSDLKKISLSFLRNSKDVCDVLKGKHQILHNYVDKRNKLHVNWLKWMGFTILKETTYGIENRKFYEFVKI